MADDLNLFCKWKTTSIYFVIGRQHQFYENRIQPQFVCNWKNNKARLGVEVVEKRIITSPVVETRKEHN
jgi:hypothetical protein